MVVAAAGSGKTTLLAHVIAASPDPVAWYQAEESDADPRIALAYIQRACEGAGVLPAAPWTCAADALDTLQDLAHPILLVVDDVHALAGTGAEAELSQLITYAPPGLHILLSSRTTPGVELDRRRLADRVVEIGSDELRFRSWEVEELFTSFYSERLAPEQLALLARRTEGWAAGLQFFHLAIRGRPRADLAGMLDDLSRRSALFGEYLAAEVMDDLDPELRMFMVRASPLGWLTGPLCDLYLGRSGSQALLSEAEHRQLFTLRVERDVFRFHEVLRRHLEQALLDLLGQAGAAAEHRRAAALLEDAGHTAEAVRAYGRGEDWASVAHLLHADSDDGTELVSSLDLPLPSAMAREPWAILSQARSLARRGCLDASIARFAQAQEAFGPSRAADVCARERIALTSWAGPMGMARPTWTDAVRLATVSQPASVSTDALAWGAPTAAIAAAAAAVLAGDLGAAQGHAAAVLDQAGSTPLQQALGRLVLLVVSVLRAEEVDHQQLGWAVEILEPEMEWVAHLAWVLGLAGTAAASEQAEALRRRCGVDGNEWGVALAGLVAALVWLRRHDTMAAEGAAAVVEALADSATIFDRMEARLLVASADAAAALVAARAGLSGGRRSPLAAERASVLAGSDLGRHLALTAVVESGTATAHQVDLLDQLSLRTGLLPPQDTRRTVGRPTQRPSSPPLHLQCFNGLVVRVSGVEADLAAVKPRARSLLRLLALHSGHPVHRELLIESLWPNHDPESATRSLQVAVSSLRQLLEPGVPRGASRFIVRLDDGYALCLPPGSRSDLVAFDEAMARGRAEARNADLQAAADAFGSVLECYTGILFPEEGAAEWVVKARQRYHMEAADAAANIGEILLGLGDELGAIASFDRCLRIDSYRDGIWRKLIATTDGVGDRMAASRARRRYEVMLGELDV